MTFAQKTNEYYEWLLAKGAVISPKIEIADLRNIGQGRAVVAKEAIEEDEELFRLPRSLTINAENCSLIQDKASLVDALLDLGQWQALILSVLYEWKVKGADSPWFPYFNVLPVNDHGSYKYNQLLFWSDDELKLLQPSQILSRVGKESARKMYEDMKVLLERFVGDVSEEDFNSVATLIMSYSFDVSKLKQTGLEEEVDEEEDLDDPDDSEPVRDSHCLKSMVPLADTLNADTHAHNASLMYSDENLVMRSIKSIAKGEQVFNSYSNHPNSEILRRYGYVELDGSLHDFAEVRLSDLGHYFGQQTGGFERIISCLKDIEVEEDEFFILDSYDCFLSGDVIFEFIFAAQLIDVIYKVDKKTAILSESPDSIRKSIQRIFKKCYQLLEARKVTDGFMTAYEAILSYRLSQYPNLNADSSQALGNETSRERQAQVVLKSEVNCLKACLERPAFLRGEEKYSVIPDQKLLNNVLKRILSENDTSHSSKKHKSG